MLIIRFILNSNNNGQNLIRVPVKYKPHHGKTIIFENKSGYCAAEHHLYFRYTDRTIPLLPTFAITSLHPSYVAVQSGFCRTWSETLKTDFSRRCSYCIDRLRACLKAVMACFAPQNFIGIIYLLFLILFSFLLFPLLYSFNNR